MLCTRHFYYRIFHANNKLSSRTFSNWQNSPIIFGSQFNQILQLNRNGCCNILIKSQKFCQQPNQFCSENDNGIPSPPFEKAQKSFVEDNLTLETQLLGLDIYNEKQLKLKFEIGKKGQKYFHFTFIKPHVPYKNYPNVPVPEDAYAFVRALDELIEELAKENFEEKLQIQDPQSSCESANDLRKTLKTVEVTGLFHKFQVELVFFPKTDKVNSRKEICLRLFAVNQFINITYKTAMIFPLQTLPWLRTKMAEMLAKYDGTEKIENIPPKIPKQFFVRNIFPPPLARYGNNVHSLYQKGMQQQFVNKKPASFQQQYSKMPNKIQNFNQNDGRTTEKGVEVLEIRRLKLEFNMNKKLQIKFEKGKSGQKFFQFTLFNNYTGQYVHYAKILVLQDAYTFVRSLDVLTGEFTAENFEQKLQIPDPQSTTEIVKKNGGRHPMGISKLKIVELTGQTNKFQLELLFFPNMNNDGQKQICLGLFAVQKITNNKHRMTLPLQALPWLRNQMAEILAKYDGIEQIAKDEPAQIPQKFFHLGNFCPPPNATGISSDQNLDYKGMQPQFANKKPASFQQQYPKITSKNQIQSEEDIEIGTLFDFDDEEVGKY